MIKYLKFSEIAYVGLIIFSIYSAISRWDVDRNKAYIFIFFSVTLTIMLYFKRKFRIRVEERRKNEEKNKK